MKDSLDTIIYVGKSKNLKSRVGSYFVNSKAHSPKVVKLVQNLKDFDYGLTDTEFEALLLECRLIKEIKPRYNRQMKSPQSYCYIKIDMEEQYPTIEICNQIDSKEKKLYFGPYTSANTVENGLNAIKEYNKILCTNSSRKASGCLKYSMGMCLGMCSANPSKEHYFAILEKIINLLKGTDLSILEEIEQEMNAAATEFNFETAAKYRDYIKAVKHLVSTAKIISFIEKNKNIALIEFLNDEEIKFFLIRYNELIFSERYKLSDFNINELKHKFESNILVHFGGALKNSVNIGKDQIDEAHIIYNYLKSKESTCRYIVVKDIWINDKDSLSIHKVVEELLSPVEDEKLKS